MKHPKIKNYKDVQIGELAYPDPSAGGYDPDDFMGTVIWKGTKEELDESEYADLAGDWEEIDFEDYDLIIIDDDHDPVNAQGPILFNYNGDPCGVVVYRPDEERNLKGKIEIKVYDDGITQLVHSLQTHEVVGLLRIMVREWEVKEIMSRSKQDKG